MSWFRKKEAVVAAPIPWLESYTKSGGPLGVNINLVRTTQKELILSVYKRDGSGKVVFDRRKYTLKNKKFLQKRGEAIAEIFGVSLQKQFCILDCAFGIDRESCGCEGCLASIEDEKVRLLK